MSTHYTIIGNWKMYFSYKQAMQWANQHLESLEELAQSTQNTIALCPSFESLEPLSSSFKNISIGLGAQDCSDHALGAYTGQVAAQSLAEIGCSHCIIGHSEKRQFGHEGNDQIAQKMIQLIKSGITPIVCIGESKEEFDQGKTLSVLEKQLAPIGKALQEQAQPATSLFIAYEPIWSIGTGITPENTYLEEIFTHIQKLTSSYPNQHSIRLLYGGSVTSQTSVTLKKVGLIEGFLIGKASTDFQELKKIVLLL